MKTKNEYTVIKDGEGWGVEWDGCLINDAPMSKQEAIKLAAECGVIDTTYKFVDGNPSELFAEQTIAQNVNYQPKDETCIQ